MRETCEWHSIPPSPPGGFSFQTIEQKATKAATAYLDRADDYRREGRAAYAWGCEKKALRKFEQAFRFRHVFFAEPLVWKRGEQLF